MKCWMLLNLCDILGIWSRKWDAFNGDFLIVEKVENGFICVSEATTISYKNQVDYHGYQLPTAKYEFSIAQYTMIMRNYI